MKNQPQSNHSIPAALERGQKPKKPKLSDWEMRQFFTPLDDHEIHPPEK